MSDAASAAARITTLDATRGVAVIGILLMNIISFSMPAPAYFNPMSWGGTSAADMAAYLLSAIFVDSKMRALFSLLFGASMVLVIDRASDKGENGGNVHFLRMATLLLIGLAHLYLLWQGDILTLYAMCGMVAFLFIDKAPRTLLWIALALFGLGLFLWLSLAVPLLTMGHMVDQGSLPATMQQDWEDMLPIIGGSADAIAQEVTAMRGNYATVFAYRAEWLVAPFAQFMLYGPETIALMLVGAAMQRSGFFSGGWTRAQLTRLGWGLGVPALLILGLLHLWLWQAGFPAVATFLVAVWVSAPFDYMLAIAYAAIIVLLVSKHSQSALVQRLAATGRAAFSNYLGTTIVMTTLFYGYGLGLFGTITRAPVYLFVVGAAILMLLWSKPWLDRFQYGPMEWLWRSMARGTLQPLRKR